MFVGTGPITDRGSSVGAAPEIFHSDGAEIASRAGLFYKHQAPTEPEKLVLCHADHESHSKSFISRQLPFEFRLVRFNIEMKGEVRPVIFDK
jgi:hypothetical protein